MTFLEEVGKYAQDLAGASEVPRAIDLDRLRVKVRGKDGATINKRVADSTIDEVRKARRGLRTGTGLGERGRSPVEAALGSRWARRRASRRSPCAPAKMKRRRRASHTCRSAGLRLSVGRSRGPSFPPPANLAGERVPLDRRDSPLNRRDSPLNRRDSPLDRRDSPLDR